MRNNNWVGPVDYSYKDFFIGLSKCKNWKDRGIYLANFFGTQPLNTNSYKHTNTAKVEK